ncbi:MAG: inositol 2-dehydrogenase [Clostridiales bacterium]|nr:inositol 2-dehydrogenase [Clostridiales bacterium]
MKPLKVGIIGAGRIGQVHAKSITYHIPQAEILAISDVRTQGLAELAASLGIPAWSGDYRDILENPEIDAVLICSSTDTHADICVEAARAGKHIFCEKPVDLTIEKINQVIHAVNKAGVKLQIGFNRRFDRNFAYVKELINEGKVGRLHMIKITSRDPEPPPAEYVAVSGGIFLDMTVHDFDMARFIAGCEVEEVFVHAGVMVDPAIGEAGDVDTAVVSMKFENGALGVIDNSRKAAYGYDQRLEAFGSAGAAKAGNDTPTQVTLLGKDGVVADKPLYFFLERYMASFTEEMEQFVDCVVHDRPVPVSVHDGLQALRVGLAAKKSLAEHRPVKLSEI